MRGEIGTPKYINSKVALIILVLIPSYLGLRPSYYIYQLNECILSK